MQSNSVHLNGQPDASMDPFAFFDEISKRDYCSNSMSELAMAGFTAQPPDQREAVPDTPFLRGLSPIPRETPDTHDETPQIEQ